MAKKICGLSLIELLVTMILMSLVLLGLFSIDLFSRDQVLSSDRRVKVQNEISYALEYMSKYVSRGTGNLNNSPIMIYPDSGPQTGFKVRVDLNNPQTPGVFSDDTWVNFYLNANSLMASTETGPLSTRICSGSDFTSVMPEYLPDPVIGFYVMINLNSVDIGLVGRYKPTDPATPVNPQVSMKTRVICPSSSER